jgi:hypothetical protein
MEAFLIIESQNCGAPVCLGFIGLGITLAGASPIRDSQLATNARTASVNDILRSDDHAGMLVPQ